MTASSQSVRRDVVRGKHCPTRTSDLVREHLFPTPLTALIERLSEFAPEARKERVRVLGFQQLSLCVCPEVSFN